MFGKGGRILPSGKFYTVFLRSTADTDFVIVAPLSGRQQKGKLYELAAV
jgi:hypothetical protein